MPIINTAAIPVIVANLPTAFCNLPPIGMVAVVAAASTLIPAMESAVRVIIDLGLIFLNRVHYGYTRITFKVADNAYTNDPLYASVGQDFIAKLQQKINQSPLVSCDIQERKTPADKMLVLRLENDPSHCFVDMAEFKKYSRLYRDLCPDDVAVDFEAFTQEAGDPNKYFDIPAEYGAGAFGLVQNYLMDKSMMNPSQVFDLTTLDPKSLAELWSLASYLQIADLEARCLLLTLPKILQIGSTDLKKIKKEINTVKGFSLETLIDFGGYSKEFEKLFNDMNAFKTNYTKDKLKAKLGTINSDLGEIVYDIAQKIFFAFGLTMCNIYPIVGPTVVHTLFIDNYREAEMLPLLSLRVMHAVKDFLLECTKVAGNVVLGAVKTVVQNPGPVSIILVGGVIGGVMSGILL